MTDLYSLFLQYPTITTDSRNCPPNSIFFALKGDRFDGNDYIEQALTNGATYAIGDRKRETNDERIIIVEDALKTLQNLANYHRKQMNATLIAITGTNGKTTTKELIATALSERYPILFTQGNLNNHIGVPLTLLNLKSEHEYAIIEMGANHVGEIAELCLIAEPDCGLITNIGKAHLEGFGSVEGIIKAKTELYDYIRSKGGFIFGNLDNLILKDFFEPINSLFYGSTEESFIHGKALSTNPFLIIEWHKGDETYYLPTHLVGGYNLENVLAAICVASHFDVESESINRALSNYIPQNNRSQSKKTERNTLIIDAYNANPSSMTVALENFFALPDSPKMVILGEMKELGEYSRKEHQKIVDLLANNKVEQVILVGESFSNAGNIPPTWQILAETQQAIDYLKKENIAGYHILIKGSRGNRLEQIIDFL